MVSIRLNVPQFLPNLWENVSLNGCMKGHGRLCNIVSVGCWCAEQIFSRNGRFILLIFCRNLVLSLYPSKLPYKMLNCTNNTNPRILFCEHVLDKTEILLYAIIIYLLWHIQITCKILSISTIMCGSFHMISLCSPL